MVVRSVHIPTAVVEHSRHGLQYAELQVLWGCNVFGGLHQRHRKRVKAKDARGSMPRTLIPPSRGGLRFTSTATLTSTLGAKLSRTIDRVAKVADPEFLQ